MECKCYLVRFIWTTVIILLAFLSSIIGETSTDNIPDGLPPSDDHQSYVWSAWSSWSPCSRTCGGGVSVQQRYCLPRSHSFLLNTTLPTPTITVRVTRQVGNCEGDGKRYHECNTEPCPGASRYTRAEQCSVYDRRPFRGRFYTWVPYIDGNAPCVLNCKPLGQYFYASLALVADGTPCTKPGARAVCVQGSCDVVGLDSVLASVDDTELRCGHRMVSGLFTRPRLPIGYTYVTTVPRGACHLNITELVASENFIALKVTNGSYIINGHFAVSTPGTFEAVGARFQYSRTAGRDWIFSRGPLFYPVDIMVLYTRPSPNIKYEYFTDPLLAEIENDSFLRVDEAEPKPPRHSRRHHAPKYMHEFGDDFDISATQSHTQTQTQTQPESEPESEPPTPALVHVDTETTTEDNIEVNQVGLRKFTWKIISFTECTRTCGGGSQIGKYRCVESGLKEVSPVHCVGSAPTSRRRRCNTAACPPRWRAAAWSNCPKCGPANRTRVVGCVQDNAKGIVKIKDKKCPGPKPAQTELCKIPSCDMVGTIYKNNKVAVNDVDNFREGKMYYSVPVTNTQNERPEYNVTLAVGWLFTEWSKCVGICGFPGVQSRAARCSNAAGCSPLPLAAVSRECTAVDDCYSDAQWFTGEWSACTADCGGWQTRGVVCVSAGAVAPRALCRGRAPEARRRCTTQCTPQWFTSGWGQCRGNCSAGSGVGWQQRSVLCAAEAGAPGAAPPACARAPPEQRQPCVLPCDAAPRAREPSRKKQKLTTTTVAPIESPVDTAKKCEDQLPNCGLAVQARLCHYNYYIKNCCKSCKGRN